MEYVISISFVYFIMGLGVSRAINEGYDEILFLLTLILWPIILVVIAVKGVK